MGRTATSDQSLSQRRGDRLGLRMDLQLLVNVFEPTFAGAGALRSAMHDMLRFARGNLDPPGSRLQTRDADDARTPSLGGPRRNVDRHGLDIRHASGRDVVWQNGGTGGYRTWIGFDKSRKVAAIVLTNSTSSNDALGFELVTGPG